MKQEDGYKCIFENETKWTRNIMLETTRLAATSSVCDSTKHNGLVTIQHKSLKLVVTGLVFHPSARCRHRLGGGHENFVQRHSPRQDVGFHDHERSRYSSDGNGKNVFFSPFLMFSGGSCPSLRCEGSPLYCSITNLTCLSRGSSMV